MRDNFNIIHPLPAIAPAAAIVDDTPWVSAWIDRCALGNAPAQSLTFLLITGVEADADATFVVTLQDADLDDQSDAAAVPDSNTLGTVELAGFTFANDGVTRKVGYVGGKRYVKFTATPVNNTAAAYLAVIALLGDLANEPAPNPPV